MKVAYLINQYPKVSHSFIRREISGLESSGFTVERFSIRSCKSELVDPDDLSEYKKTRVILNVGYINLFVCLLYFLFRKSRRWLKAFIFALKLGQVSRRGIFYHIVYLAESCVLSYWVKQIGITHIHAHFGTNSTTVAMLCSFISDVPYSFTIHGPDEFDEPRQISLQDKILYADFVTTISYFSKSQLCRWCDYDQWGKIYVVHCGLDEAFLDQKFSEIVNNSQFVSEGTISY
jgi:hypothetical protein